MTRQELEKLVEEEATKYRGTVIVQNAPSPIYREYVGDLCRESYESSGKFVMDKLFPVIGELEGKSLAEKELSDLREFAEKAKEVIQFYGSESSWQMPSNQFQLGEHEDDYDLADMIDDDTELSDEKRGGFGGKRARELQSSDIWKRVFK